MSDFLSKRFWILPAWVLLLLITVVPIIALSFYNHPSAADDFCFAYMARDYGIWWSTKFYYEQWSGRYLANVLFHVTPLFANGFWYFKVLPIVYLLTTFWSLYALVGVLFKISPAHKFMITAALVIAYVLQMASLAEGFYWATVSYTYILPQILTTFLLVILSKAYESRSAVAANSWLFLAAVFIVGIVGLCEMFVILLGGLLGSFLLYQLLFNRKFDLRLVFLLGVTLVSSYFILQSPGSKVRQHANPLGGNLVFSLPMSFRTTAELALHWMPLILIFVVFWLVWLANREDRAFRSYLRIRPWAGWLVWAGLTPLLFFPYFYGVGMDEVPVRITNTVYYFYLTGLFYNLTVSVLWLRETKGLEVAQPAILKALLMLALLAVPVAYAFNKNFRMMTRDLTTGTAAQYDRELTERYAYIRQSKQDTVTIAPLQHVPASLFTEDIKENTTHLWNKCESQFFGKKALILQTKE